MPEGPEVRKIVERLDRFYRGRKVTEIDFYDPTYHQKQVRDDVEEFVSSLPATVESVKCKGKFIYWTFTNGFVMFHTLGMSGTWRIQEKNPKYGRLCFIRDDGKKCHYKDYRRFGTFKIFRPEVAQEKLQRKLLKDLGPDILNEEVTFSEWEQRFRKVNHYNVTKAMMNQKVVSGIGNYIKAEALYHAGISPHRTVESLTDQELQALHRCSVWVIKASYEARGATRKGYEMPDGSKSDFKFKFNVYAQETDPAGRTVIRDKTPDGRTTHWVKEIQL